MSNEQLDGFVITFEILHALSPTVARELPMGPRTKWPLKVPLTIKIKNIVYTNFNAEENPEKSSDSFLDCLTFF